MKNIVFVKEEILQLKFFKQKYTEVYNIALQSLVDANNANAIIRKHSSLVQTLCSLSERASEEYIFGKLILQLKSF